MLDLVGTQEERLQRAERKVPLVPDHHIRHAQVVVPLRLEQKVPIQPVYRSEQRPGWATVTHVSGNRG